MSSSSEQLSRRYVTQMKHTLYQLWYDANMDQSNQSNLDSDFVSWFEPLYKRAAGDSSRVPWAEMDVNQQFDEWLTTHDVHGNGRRALVIGCGLGDDAEELARRGFVVTAFDVSETAIEWCKQRFPDSAVHYVAADMFQPPADWAQAFDFVLEIQIVQALPQSIRQRAIEAEVHFVAPGGELLVICDGRPEHIQVPQGPPWRMSSAELAGFVAAGLTEVVVEELGFPKRKFRAHYRR